MVLIAVRTTLLISQWLFSPRDKWCLYFDRTQVRIRPVGTTSSLFTKSVNLYNFQQIKIQSVPILDSDWVWASYLQMTVCLSSRRGAGPSWAVSTWSTKTQNIWFIDIVIVVLCLYKYIFRLRSLILLAAWLLRLIFLYLVSSDRGNEFNEVTLICVIDFPSSRA